MSGSFDTTVQQVNAARAGDAAAMQALFTRYHGWVVDTVALRLGRRRAECSEIDDIAQESLLDAFRSLARFEQSTEGSFRLWLARIVENNVIDADRRRRAQKRGGGDVRRLSATEADQLPGRDETPSQVARDREAVTLVERAMLELPPRQREILILRDRCDLSFEEVAAEAGLGSAESARTTYRRALQAFAAVLQGLGNAP